jgi:hypothetical protein
MDIETFTLFVALLLFSAFNLYANLRGGPTWLRAITVSMMLIGVGGMLYILAICL